MNRLNKVIIFGATSDIAETVARQLVGEGASIYCVGRDAERLSALVNDLRLRAGAEQFIGGGVVDLNEVQHHETIWQKALEHLHGCDAVLMAQGVLPNQEKCEQSAKEALTSIHLNALSVISLLTPIANYFENQKHGVIGVITSVAGDRGRQSNYVYGSAKGMLNIFLQGLRNRLFRSGVSVVTIKPGFTRTRMTEGMKRDSFLWANPNEIGAGIIQAMRKGKNEVYLKPIWRLIMMIIQALPEFIFKRLKL